VLSEVFFIKTFPVWFKLVLDAQIVMQTTSRIKALSGEVHPDWVAGDRSYLRYFPEILSVFTCPIHGYS